MKKMLLLVCMMASVTAFAQSFNVTFQVNMSNQTVGANGVHIAGNLQAAAGFPGDWDPATTELTDANADGIYEVTVQLPAGTYQYKFINGNAWGTDEAVPGACNAGGNREVVVSADATVPSVCFGTCDAVCNVVVPVQVTLRVDMSGEANTPDTIHVAGQFQGWNPGGTAMTDANGDGIYEAVVTMNSGLQPYKFVKGNSWGQDEAIPCPCAVGGNRELSVPNNGPTFDAPVVCFAQCAACPANTVDVEFYMNIDPNITGQLPGGVQAVRVFAPLATEYPMVNEPAGSDQWKAVVTLPAGTFVYDFKIDATEENSTDLNSCGCEYFGGDRRRSLDLTGQTGTVTLPSYYFDACTIATTLTGLNQIADINRFTVAPNPFDGNAVVSFNNEAGKEYTLVLTNITGQTVRTIGNITGEQVSISRDGLASGLYFLTLQNNAGERLTHKVVIR
jgi:hypothetical protein